MARLRVASPLSADDLREVTELIEAVSARDGRPPLDEQQQLALTSAGPTDLVAVVARQGRHAPVVGYAQATRGPRAWRLALVGPDLRRARGAPVPDPGREHEPPAGPSASEMLAVLLGEVARRGGGRVELLVPDATGASDAWAGGHGLAAERELFQMRRPLPLSGLPGPAIDTRAFVPGADEKRWLEVNNRAFETHPEQGLWDLSTLLLREREPWFDPSGFLLHERDGRLAAFCWTKVHASARPPLGEIYVIAVDPDFHGLGLGRAMTVTGLEWLAGAGLRVAMLYVDAGNRPARSLYGSLGFEVDHVDRSYTAVVDAAQPAPDAPTARPIE